MKSELTKSVSSLRAGLQTLLDKGFYEETKKVCGIQVVMHILVDEEEAAVSKSLKDLDMVTRGYVQPTEFLAHAVSEVNGVAFEDVEEARTFFGLMTPTMRDEYVKAYNEMIPKEKEQIQKLVDELKN